MPREMFLIAILAGCFCAGCEKSPAPSSVPNDPPAATQPAEGLFPIVQDRQWGYMNVKGDIVIAPRYQQAEAFSEGLAAVQRDGLWGFINPAGAMVIPPQFQAVDQGGFSAGRISVLQASQWRVIDATGKTFLPGPFASPIRFREGLAVVREQNRFGFIDADGKTVIEPKFTYAGDFSRGLAPVMIDGQWTGRRVSGGLWGYIDKTGQLKIPSQFQEARPFSEGLAWVQFAPPANHTADETRKRSGGFIDEKGQVAIRSSEYLAAREFHEGRAAVQLRYTGLWGFIRQADATGQIVIAADYDQVGDFHEGLAAVLTFGPNGSGVKWGYIDRDGDMVIPPQFDRASDFHAGLAAVWIGGKLGYVGRDGQFLRTPTE